MKSSTRRRVAAGLLVLLVSATACRRSPSTHGHGGSESPVALAVTGTRWDEWGGLSAHEFLAGLPSGWQPLFAPDDFKHKDWTGVFIDAATLSNSEVESDETRFGLEGASLVFYAGHGVLQWKETMFQAWEDRGVALSRISPGDRNTRYVLMNSCNVLAHGPYSEKNQDYDAPQNFKPDDQNVFRTWGTDYDQSFKTRIPLNPRMRLVCGGSSRVGLGTPSSSEDFWTYKTKLGLPVADSFILSLAYLQQVPLCIARGRSREKSPLYDSEIFPDEAPGGKRLFIQYPIFGTPVDTVVKKVIQQLQKLPVPGKPFRAEPPLDAPPLVVGPTPLPAILAPLADSGTPWLGYGFRGGAADKFLAAPDSENSESSFLGDICLRRNERSGGVVLSWKPWRMAPSPADEARPEPPPFFLQPPAAGLTGEKATSFVQLSPTRLFEYLGLTSAQWTGHSNLPNIRPLYPSFQGLRMQVDGTEDLQATKLEKKTKCLYFRLQGMMEVNGEPTRVLGRGGEWLLGWCPRQGPGSAPARLRSMADACERPVPPVLTLSWIGRSVTGFAAASPRVLGLSEARSRALTRLDKLGDAAAYREVGHRWGYRAAPAHCTQDKMYLVYEFDFVPKEGAPAGTPPLTVEVPGHDLNRPIETTWSCASDRPDG